MEISLLRFYLLAGLVAHKAVWEWLKRGQPPAARQAHSPFETAVKAVKMGILGGLLAQTMLPTALPIVADAGLLQVAGAAIYTAGLATAILGRLQLGTNWADIEAAQVFGEQTLVASGVYRYIRHPIYSGDLLLLLGFELALNSWLVVGMAAITPVVVRQALREEHMLAGRLPGYTAYQTRTKRFIPLVV
jgi:protein-S-isoprenylcysteine O-methyltransferase Ste14